MRAVGQQRLAGQDPDGDRDEECGRGRHQDLQLEYCDHLPWCEADRLHDPDLSVGRDHDASHQVGDDRRRGRQREDAERDQHAGHDLVGDVEDVSNQDVVERAHDASRRQRGPDSIGDRLKLGARRIGGEPIGHQKVGRFFGGQGGYGRAQRPCVLAAEVRASLIDVHYLGRDGKDRLLRNAHDLDLLADRDMVQLGKRARERDLVVRARPAACGDAELLHIAAGVVTADRVDSELPAAGLELQRRDRIRPAERRRADQPWSPGHCRRVGAAVVCDLQVSTLLCVEGGLVGIMRLRQKREGHGSGSNG